MKHTFTKRHKYNAQATVVDGIKFGSKAEARKYVDLRNQQSAGEVELIGHALSEYKHHITPEQLNWRRHELADR